MKPAVSVPISLAGLPLLLGLWGCSAAIALSQYAERTSPHSIQYNVTRAEVERELGTPITTWVFDDGSSISTYQDKVYNLSPYWTRNSNSPGVRAFFEVLYDVLTLGLIEAFSTPYEVAGKIYRSKKGTTYEVTVTYDADGRVVDVSRQIAGSQGGAKDGNQIQLLRFGGRVALTIRGGCEAGSWKDSDLGTLGRDRLHSRWVFSAFRLTQTGAIVIDAA